MGNNLSIEITKTFTKGKTMGSSIDFVNYFLNIYEVIKREENEVSGIKNENDSNNLAMEIAKTFTEGKTMGGVVDFVDFFLDVYDLAEKEMIERGMSNSSSVKNEESRNNLAIEIAKTFTDGKTMGSIDGFKDFFLGVYKVSMVEVIKRENKKEEERVKPKGLA